MVQTTPTPQTAWMAAILAFLLFAGQFVLSRQGIVAGLTPYDIVALRFGVAGPVAAGLLLWLRPDGINWARGLTLTIFAGAPYFMMMLQGLSYAPASNVVIINPGMTLVGGVTLAALLPGDRMTGRQLVAAAVALGGLLLVGGATLLSDQGQAWIGNLWFALSGLSWAIFMVLLKRWRVHPGWAALMVAALSLPYLLWYALAAPAGTVQVPVSEYLIQAIYHGIIHALLAMWLFAYAVRALGPGVMALMTPIVPVTGLILSVAFLAERPVPLQWVGALLVCLAMGILASPQRKSG